MEEETIALADLQITHGINTSNYENETVVRAHGMDYFYIRWIHNGQKPDEYIFEQLRTYILKALENPDARIACHCIAGGQRSATTVYLALRLQGHEIEEAHAMIDLVTTDNPSYSHFVDDWLEARKTNSFPIAFS
jgi:protein-tyrosine phosphatase